MSDANNLPENAEAGPAPRKTAKASFERLCSECGRPFVMTSDARVAHKRFCSDAHRKAFNNRNTAQGGPLVPLLKAWRVSRSGSPDDRKIGAEALSEISSILDGMIAEDRKAGRSTRIIIDHAAAGLNSGMRYIDRTRRR